MKLAALATQGSGNAKAISMDEARILGLLEKLAPETLPFDRARKPDSFIRLLKTLRDRRDLLVCMEGTGIAGGAALLLGRLLYRTRYLISSGDAVGPFVGAHHPALGPLFTLYELLLCRLSEGFIGWTPYLSGRALSFGAPRAMTAPGWAPFPKPAEINEARRRVRSRLGIPENALVIGIAGSLSWNPRAGYCYGWESVAALLRLRDGETSKARPVHALIVGDGDGRERLARLAADRLGRTVHLTGRVPREEIPEHLAAMDLGSLPQSVDGVGSFRYSTKMSEYVACRLPFVTGEIPLAYDLPGDFCWRLPGAAPWSAEYIDSLAALLETVTDPEIECKRAGLAGLDPLFDREHQIRRVTEFVSGITARLGAPGAKG